MNYDDWHPIYERILADFGFDAAADRRARDLLAERARPFDLARIRVDGLTVAIAGGADSLAEDVPIARTADTVFATSNAAEVLEDADVTVDLLVTDLDKNLETAIAMTQAGRPVAVHAHGDNIPLLERALEEMDLGQVIATTQAEPRGDVRNFGGFTDGDRAAFLADHLGAASLTFPGWDFDDPTVDPVKRRKLAWAERLLFLLENRRNQRFSVLDGRRAAIEDLSR